MIVRHPRRLPLLAMAVLGLLAGIAGGLSRIGWNVVLPMPSWPLLHGPLMVCGFVGVVISLERAVAHGAWWAYMIPATAGLGTMGLVIGLPVAACAGLFVAASAGLVCVLADLARRGPAVFTALMAGGAAAWLVGNLCWAAGTPLSQAALWWQAFLLLTIAGERMELGRIQRPSVWRRWSGAVVAGVYAAGLIASFWDAVFGAQLAGLGMAGVALWLAFWDVARRTVRQPGLPRFIAVCLLTGYGWLFVAGAALSGFGGEGAGPHYDFAQHAFFLGFVFAMIFGHAPVIFPAVLGGVVRYAPRFYGHLALLQVSLVLRLASDVAQWPAGRRIGGLLNGAALLWFMGNTAWSVIRGGRGAPRHASDRMRRYGSEEGALDDAKA